MLSARGKTTDELVAQAHEISERPVAREMDMLLSTGERISCALAAMAIHDMGHEAISLTGSQAGIVTDSVHTKARIIDVRADRIRAGLADDRIVLVAGFQGVSGDSKDVTTLGRGASDLTAVALAAALHGDCEIYSDVEGVYTADPRIVPHARKLRAVSTTEMLEMAGSGARILQLRSVEFARNHGVAVHVRSTFSDAEGTWIREDSYMEDAIISGITHTTDEAYVTLTEQRNPHGPVRREHRSRDERVELSAAQLPLHIRDVERRGTYYNDFATYPLDVNGDGHTDYLTASYFGKNVGWVENPGKAGGTWAYHEIDVPGTSEAAAMVDLTGDGGPVVRDKE